MELPAINLPELQVSYYDATLVGASVVTTLAIIGGWKFIGPWWGARKMRADQEKVERVLMARATLNMLTETLLSGEVKPESVAIWHKRFASLLPLKELMRDSDFQPLKELLEKKHPKKEVTAPTENVVKLSAFARMSARKTAIA